MSHRTARGPTTTRQQPKKSGFAGSVVSNQSEDIAVGKRERDIAQNRRGLVVEVDTVGDKLCGVVRKVGGGGGTGRHMSILVLVDSRFGI